MRSSAACERAAALGLAACLAISVAEPRSAASAMDLGWSAGAHSLWHLGWSWRGHGDGARAVATRIDVRRQWPSLLSPPDDPVEAQFSAAVEYPWCRESAGMSLCLGGGLSLGFGVRQGRLLRENDRGGLFGSYRAYARQTYLGPGIPVEADLTFGDKGVRPGLRLARDFNADYSVTDFGLRLAF